MVYESPNKNTKSLAWRGDKLGGIVERKMLENDISVCALATTVGIHYSSVSRLILGKREYVEMSQGEKLLEAVGMSPPWPDGCLVEVSRSVMTRADRISPMVRAEWVKGIIETYLKEDDSNSMVSLARKSDVTERILRRICKSDQRICSLSIADRIWVGAGHTGPLPKEAWSRDKHGRKVYGYNHFN